MDSVKDQFCRQCHAAVAASADQPSIPALCPACGGALIPFPGPDPDPPGAPPRQVDHRGIVLPRRHAVGGVITPR